MGPRKQAGFNSDWPNGFPVAAVYARLFFENTFAHGRLLQILDAGLNGANVIFTGIFARERPDHPFFDPADELLPGNLVGDLVGLFDIGSGQFLDLLCQRLIFFWCLPIPALNADFLS